MELKEGFIITDAGTKKKILSDLKGLKNYIFLSYNELLMKYYGFVKKNALFHLENDYSISYDLAHEYMKYIPYVEEKFYNNEKLDSLVSLKKYLIKHDLIEKDIFFIHRFYLRG